MTEEQLGKYALEAISPAFGLVRMKEFVRTVAAEARKEGIEEMAEWIRKTVDEMRESGETDLRGIKWSIDPEVERLKEQG